MRLAPGIDGVLSQADMVWAIAAPFVLVVSQPSSVAATDNIRVAQRAMKQAAVYWAVRGLDDFGRPTYEYPIEIDCRWEDTVEEFVTPEGDQEVSKAKLIVDRDLVLKGVVFLGELDSTVDVDDPKANDGAWEIRSVLQTPDFKGRRFLREVYL